MAVSLRWGTVTDVGERLEELIRCEVDGIPCLAYPRQTGDVLAGDTVLVNTQSRDLELDSSGADILYANLTRGIGLPPPPDARALVDAYAPTQRVSQLVEETDELAESLDGMPVVCCGIHSQLAPAVAGFGPGRIAYVQLAGGALPVSLSDTVRGLKLRRRIDLALAVSPCSDGDAQALTLASALAWVRARGFDVAMCAIGPNIVSTRSSLGHGGMAVADAVNTASALGGRPIVCVRYSDADERPGQLGVSEYTRSALRLCLGEHAVAWPAGGPERPGWLAAAKEVDVDGWVEACEGLELSHRGSGLAGDPWFFASAFAAGRLARTYLD